MDKHQCETTFWPAGSEERERCYNEATGYCENCDEELCETCIFNRHRSCKDYIHEGLRP